MDNFSFAGTTTGKDSCHVRPAQSWFCRRGLPGCWPGVLDSYLAHLAENLKRSRCGLPLCRDCFRLQRQSDLAHGPDHRQYPRGGPASELESARPCGISFPGECSAYHSEERAELAREASAHHRRRRPPASPRRFRHRDTVATSPAPGIAPVTIAMTSGFRAGGRLLRRRRADHLR